MRRGQVVESLVDVGGVYGRLRRAVTRVVQDKDEVVDLIATRYADELGDPELARRGEIYLYARFRDAVPLELVEEFDHLEPRTLEAIERIETPETANR